LTRASHIAAAQRADCVMILPADLPLLTPEDIKVMISSVGESGRGNRKSYYYQKRAMAICSDHNAEGTNALLICPPNGYKFQYGPNSFSLHLEEAKRLEMDRRIVHTPGIKFDLDTEEDWITYQAIQGDVLPLGQAVHG
jgi:2-phospho-L-lactate guanylyltransferase